MSFSNWNPNEKPFVKRPKGMHMHVLRLNISVDNNNNQKQ